ncbi:hypothetical protein J4437_07570 [Candidatus Woesearchaeota archaeon]|nr:hypothetical protein [uncultured archaeon]MBS3124457.1 hypothetical protein [Candidatus Woesearchaeota archaeon]
MATPPQSGEFDLAKLYLWVKGLESKANSVIRELDVLKNDLVKKNIDLRKEVKILGEDFLSLRHEHEKSLQKMDLVIQELKQTAGKEEVTVLKKYLELWSPLNFVSQRDLDRALQNKIEALRLNEVKEPSVNNQGGIALGDKMNNKSNIVNFSENNFDDDEFRQNNLITADKITSEKNKNIKSVFKVSDTGSDDYNPLQKKVIRTNKEVSETNKKEKHLPFA